MSYSADVSSGPPVTQALLSSFQNGMLKAGTDIAVSTIMVPVLAAVLKSGIPWHSTYTANFTTSKSTWDGIQSRFGSNLLWGTAFLAFGYLFVRARS